MRDLNGASWWTHMLKEFSGGDSMQKGIVMAVVAIVGGTILVTEGGKKLYKTVKNSQKGPEAEKGQ